MPFFERPRRDGTLKRLLARHYGHAAKFSAIDSGALLEDIATRLPKLKPYFEEGEQVSGIDPRLIAAIGYQESHWDPGATSPTGVRGLMMLTEETADRLQVKNRLDPRESIVGGARYFALVKGVCSVAAHRGAGPHVPRARRVQPGHLGHLEDGRILAQRAGLNPDKWQDVRQALPRLAEPDAFQSLAHGYARGLRGRAVRGQRAQLLRHPL